jgi:hypothetical protein
MTTQERLIERINALPPAKVFAVSAFIDSITSRPTPEEVSQSIADYAAEFGGTEFDLDRDLEAAGLDSLRRMYEAEEE